MKEEKMSINKDNKEIVLISDIGGTNVRFALYTEGQTTPLVFDGKYKCTEFSSFEHAVQYYLSDKNVKPTLCVAGAAGNLDEVTGEILSSNTPWCASKPKLLARMPYLKDVCIVNDFALQGWALTEMDETQYRAMFSDKHMVDLSNGNIVVIGPGTGLGTCLIKQSGPDSQMIYTSEAGHSTMPHVDFDNPKDNADRDIVLSALKDFYAKKQGTKPITEHIVSGTGLVNVYQALKYGYIPDKKGEKMQAQEIEKLAQNGDEIALRTFKIFNAYLGAHAGSLAATEKADKIFFCGGLMASDWVVEQLEQSSDFKHQFQTRAGMTRAMEQVQFVASKDRDMAVLGALVRSKRLIEEIQLKQEERKSCKDMCVALTILNAFIEKEYPELRPEMERLQSAVEQVKRARMHQMREGHYLA